MAEFLGSFRLYIYILYQPDPKRKFWLLQMNRSPSFSEAPRQIPSCLNWTNTSGQNYNIGCCLGLNLLDKQPGRWVKLTGWDSQGLCLELEEDLGSLPNPHPCPVFTEQTNTSTTIYSLFTLVTIEVIYAHYRKYWKVPSRLITNHEHLVNLLLIFLKDAPFRLYNICVCQSFYQFVYLSSVLYSVLHFNLALSEDFPRNTENLISKVVEEVDLGGRR